jgi:5-methylthioadenosine/S-adenosylhomocysteine deaminase
VIDLLISHGIVITMDPERRVIENGAVAILGDRIVAVGPTEMVLRSHPQAQRVIKASLKVVLPGFIDGHAHAGHGLVKTMGTDTGEAWYQAVEQIYTEGSTEAFWEAEALLSALERLKCGTTTGVSYLGGGESIMRTDDPAYGAAYCRAVAQVGNRAFLAVGPGRPPFPRRYAQWTGQDWREVMVSFEQQLATCETLIQGWHGQADGRLRLCLCFPTHKPDSDSLSPAEFQLLRTQAQATRNLSRQYKLLFTQDGHTQGTIQFAHEQLDLLGPDVFLSHCTNLTSEEIDICRRTDTRVVHNPSAIFSILGRCPVPELLDAGVTVMLGSDGTAPDRSYDMFRHMFQCMHYHRTYYHDPSYLPPGKALEMVTIDAAQGLGLAHELGSLEPGKKADLILVDLYKPHTYPLNMPVYRTVYFANGADVDTVIVDGKILMEQRVVQTVDEAKVLDMAQRETEAMLERTGLRHLLEIPDGFWGHSRFPNRGPKSG